MCLASADPFKANDTLLPNHHIDLLTLLNWPQIVILASDPLFTYEKRHPLPVQSRATMAPLRADYNLNYLRVIPAKGEVDLKRPPSATVIKQNERELSTE